MPKIICSHIDREGTAYLREDSIEGITPRPITHGHTIAAQCWMQCGTGLVKMFKRSMLLRHRIDPSNIMPRHHPAYQMNNAKNH